MIYRDHVLHGMPRALDCASCPGRGEFERCVWRVGNFNRIYLFFWRNTPVSFLVFAGFDGFTRTKAPLSVNNSFKRVFKRSLKVSLRHISLKSVLSVCLKTKFVFEERYFSSNWWGIWTAFLPRGEGIWTSQSSKVQIPGALPGGGCWTFELIGAFC